MSPGGQGRNSFEDLASEGVSNTRSSDTDHVGPTTTFTRNERVLCYLGSMIYKVKIPKVDNWDEATTRIGFIGPHFFVHYKGWKQTRVSVTFPLNDPRRI